MYSKQEKVVIWLSIFEGLTLKKQHMLLNLYTDVGALWDNFEKDKNLIIDIVKEETYNKMLFALDDSFVNTYIKNCEDLGISIVTFVSKEYPDMLKETNSPPVVLYCKGNVGLLNSPCVAIVGTRRCTRYGKEITYKFGYDIAKSGLTVVSGLADGVDTVAHTSCLDAGGNTIAVLGSGLNNIYPATNIPLANKIIENNGLLISEYKPSEKPSSYNFPARNRIIAGLSKGVLITEATEKSGSMHTKDYALENNRDIFVVPGRLTDIYSAGCNKIIKNLQSAIVLEPSEIINTYGKELHKEENKVFVQLSLEEQMLLDALGTDDMHYDQLLHILNFAPRALTTLLLRMEIKGLIVKLSGNIYRKNNLEE